jgi:hypothetical protein
MPTYSIKDKNTGEVTEKFLYLSEFDQFFADNPHLESIITKAPAVVSGVGIFNKMDTDFKSRLKEMKKAHKGSNINI